MPARVNHVFYVAQVYGRRPELLQVPAPVIHMEKWGEAPCVSLLARLRGTVRHKVVFREVQ